MLAQFPADQQGIRDFRQRYLSSYGYYTIPETGQKLLVQIAAVSDGVAEFVDRRGITYTANSGKGVEFEFIPVEKKLYVYSDNLMFIRRHPQKQWSRGINQNNCQLFNLTRRWNLSGDPRSEQMTFNRLMACLSVPLPVHHAMIMLEAGEVKSVVLSNLFGITNNRLFLYDQFVGRVNIANRQITVIEPIFLQEILDLVSRLNLNYMVMNGNA